MRTVRWCAVVLVAALAACRDEQAGPKTPVAWPTREPVPDTPASAQPEGGFAHGG
jgi:hypothetical protein